MGGVDTKRGAQQPQSSDTSPFDQWLRLSLRRDHDGVLTEPVPQAMLRILSDHPAVKADSERDGRQRHA
jgi:hypothetical protein